MIGRHGGWCRFLRGCRLMSASCHSVRPFAFASCERSSANTQRASRTNPIFGPERISTAPDTQMSLRTDYINKIKCYFFFSVSLLKKNQ